MVQKIEFRGKRIDNGEWVYGYYAPSLKDNAIAYIGQKKPTGVFMVIPESLSQCVCIRDKNNKDYFFNDIVKTNRGKGVLVWMDDRLGIASGNINDYHAIDEISKMELEESEIIGKAFDGY